MWGEEGAAAAGGKRTKLVKSIHVQIHVSAPSCLCTVYSYDYVKENYLDIPFMFVFAFKNDSDK